MAFNSYYLNILVRIFFMSVTNLGFFYVLLQRGRFFTLIFLGMLFVIQVIWFVYYANSVNRSLSRFLLTLGEEETMTMPIQNKIEKTFRGLQHSFKKVNSEIARMRLENRYSTVLMQNIINHLGSGILAWRDNGEIELVNDAGLRLLNSNKVRSIGQLENIFPGLAIRLNEMKPGEKTRLDLMVQGSTMPFLFRATTFLLGKERIRLVAFQSIRSELEENEMVSWEKLIRVLSHEVSNSVTPITTLGTNIKKRMATIMAEPGSEYKIAKQLASDLHRSAELIEQRGNSLVDFIQQYKSLMRLPEPDLKPVRIKNIFDHVSTLCENLEIPARCRITSRADPAGITCMADHKQLEQALINLVKNALEAIPAGRDGLIEISAASGDNSVLISIRDNGQGIPKDVLDQVCIPFFTTREKGSGIGLSLSRRIIHRHRGTFSVTSEENKGTRVTIELPTARP
jgi:two-component system nitrogen regulation sensor histidine kinase NtrY